MLPPAGAQAHYTMHTSWHTAANFYGCIKRTFTCNPSSQSADKSGEHFNKKVEAESAYFHENTPHVFFFSFLEFSIAAAAEQHRSEVLADVFTE